MSNKQVKIKFPPDPVKLAKVLDVMFGGEEFPVMMYDELIEKLREFTEVEIIESS